MSGLWWGSFAPGGITLTGANGSNRSGQSGRTDTAATSASLYGGSFVCWEGDPCGSCSGGFGLQLFATQGADRRHPQSAASAAEPVWLALTSISIVSRTPNGPFISTTTDANGHFEFRASTEPGRSNNWGVGVDATYSPSGHSGVGQATYYVFAGGTALAQASVSSSQLSTVNLKLPNPRAGGGGSPDNRGDSEGGGGCGGGSGGGSGGGIGQRSGEGLRRWGRQRAPRPVPRRPAGERPDGQRLTSIRPTCPSRGSRVSTSCAATTARTPTTTSPRT